MNLDSSVIGCSGGSRGNNNNNRKKRSTTATLSNSHPLLRFPLDGSNDNADGDDGNNVMSKAIPFRDPLYQLQREQRAFQPPPRSFETILDHAVDVALVKFTPSSSSPSPPKKKEKPTSENKTIPLKTPATNAAAAAAAGSGGGGTASKTTTTTTSKVIPDDDDGGSGRCVTGRIRKRSSSFNSNDLVDGHVEERILLRRRNKTMMKKRKTI